MEPETNTTPNDSKDEAVHSEGSRGETSNAAHALDAKLRGPLAPLEMALDGVFGKKAAYQLPTDIKQLLVKFAPWLSLVAGILGVLSAVNMWRAAHYVNRTSEAFGVSEYVLPSQLSVMFWISLAMTILFSVLALLAFPGLKAEKKVGWNFMFYSMLANVLYGVVSLFYGGGGLSSFIFALIMSAVGFYILFQVRDQYKV